MKKLSFHGLCKLNTYIELHHQAGIGLDIAPYKGGTTRHALWMVEPMLTPADHTAIGHARASMLSHAGLKKFIAQNADGFVQ